MLSNDENIFVCRVCTTEVGAQNKSYNIFERYEDLLTPGTSEDDILIAGKITACANVKIEVHDGLPNRICVTCVQELENAYKFRRKCEKSDNILRIASNIKYEVTIKEESGSETDNSVSDDNETPLRTDNIKPKLERSSSVEDINDEEQTDEIVPSVFVQTAYNSSIGVEGQNWDHQRTEPPNTCLSCKLNFKSSEAFHKHMTNRSKTCISLSNIRIEGFGISRHFYCKECEYTSNNVRNAVQHLDVHAKQCQYKCDQCDRSFVRIVTLKAHKERAHKQYYGEKACHVCGKVFKGFTSYESHMRIHKVKNKAHCNICNRILSSKNSLQTHMKTHSDLKAYACEKCPSRFRTSAGLNSHKAVHKEAIVACRICGYKVKNLYTVKKHESEHDNSNVACGMCGKFFNSEEELAIHLKRHYKSHPCTYCNKMYTSRKNLTEHLRKVHQIYVSTSDYKANNKKMKKLNTNLSDLVEIYIPPTEVKE